MRFSDFETAVSIERMSRYLLATNGNQNKARLLYRLNLRTSQEIFGLFGLFEVILRNAIDRHYSVQFSDADWLYNQCSQHGMFSSPPLARSRFLSRKVILDSHSKLGIKYGPNSMVASLNFGIWCYLFAPIEFRAGGQTLHRIFPKRPSGVNSTMIFNDLEKLRFFRNRIAHHEPIIFGPNGIQTLWVKEVHRNLCEKIAWLGFQPDKLFHGIDRSANLFKLIDAF